MTAGQGHDSAEGDATDGVPAKSGHTLGVSIEIPSPFGEELDALRQEYSAAPDDMAAHVTVLAPIDADADVMATVQRHLADVAARTRPFRLVLRGAGTFRPVSPVVFVAVAEGISACEQLERAVRSGDLGVEARYPYHPHVTIAHDLSEDDLERAFKGLADYSAVMEISSMALHEIVDGSWQLVRRFPFGA